MLPNLVDSYTHHIVMQVLLALRSSCIAVHDKALVHF